MEVFPWTITDLKLTLPHEVCLRKWEFDKGAVSLTLLYLDKGNVNRIAHCKVAYILKVIFPCYAVLLEFVLFLWLTVYIHVGCDRAQDRQIIPVTVRRMKRERYRQGQRTGE